ncbi:MAG: hypothetical protein AAFO57_06115 [Pseudomonadota bacterium]
MPWSEIESSVGREFSIEQRAEIHDCAVHFFLELDLHRTAASRSETSSLRALVVEHLRGLVEIEDRYIATLRDDKNDSEDDRNRKDAQRRRNNACALLNSEASSSELDLRDELSLLGKRAAWILSNMNETNYDPDAVQLEVSKMPETIALVSFIERVLHGVVEKEARGSQVWAVKKERQRWGIAVGPRVQEFRIFINTILNYDFSQNQIKTAFEEAVMRVGMGQAE